MSSPGQLFQEMWREKLSGSNSKHYSPGENQRVDAAAKLLLSGERLLDVGCGAGILALAVKGKFREVFGVDLAESAVEAARSNGVISTRTDLNHDALPFDSESFDAVTFLSALPYIYDPYHALRECHRVLRKEGAFIISAANMRTLGKLVSIAVRGRFPTTSKGINIGYDGGTMHYFCSRNLEDLLSNSGFKVIEKQGIYYKPHVVRVFSAMPIISSLMAEFFGGELIFRASKIEITG